MLADHPVAFIILNKKYIYYKEKKLDAQRNAGNASNTYSLADR